MGDPIFTVITLLKVYSMSHRCLTPAYVSTPVSVSPPTPSADESGEKQSTDVDWSEYYER